MGGISNTSHHVHHMNSQMPSVNHYSQNKHHDVNNTNDLNPMIMMSGEEGDASYNNSQVNMTAVTNHQHIGTV